MAATRMALLAAAALLLLLLGGVTAQDDRCDDSWQFSDISGTAYCYRYFTTKKSWDGANSDCQGRSAHIVSIANSAENDFVYGLCQSRRCHIGINDIAREGTYVWSDGSSVSYTRWNSGEPNNCCGSEDCGEMWHVGGATPTWNDMPCNGRFGSFDYVCKKDAGCEAGKYGSNGACTSCPAGRYRAQGGATTQSDCANCPAGRYGSTTGQTSEQCTGACSKGHYCPSGSTKADQNDCPHGTYGSVTELPSSACSGSCAAGYYCELAETTSEPTGKQCVAGRYGSFGQINSQCVGPCSAGYYCPIGSSSSTQAECGGSNKYCPEGSSTPSTVSTGYYTTGGAGATTRTSQVICEMGYYCTGGVRYSCPAGKYGGSTGLSATSGTNGCQTCSEGYYCLAQSVSATQEVCGSGANAANQYCPAGTTTRLTVTAGYYSTPEDFPVDRRSAQAQCTDTYVCANGIRKPKLEWVDSTNPETECATEGLATVSANENEANQNVVTLTAISNEGLSVSYAIDSVTPNSGCTLSNPFTYSSAGVLAVGSTAIDREVCNSFVVTVKVTAGSNAITCPVTVNIADTNDQPTIEETPVREVAERSKINTLVGATIYASDPDVGQELTYTLTGGDDKFKISSCSGQIRTLTADLDANTKSSYTVTVTVSDDGTPVLTDTTTVTINILNVNDPPEFGAAPTLEVADNAAEGDGLVSTAKGVTATDPDGNAILYSITRNDGDTFNIVESTGVLTVAASNLVDYDAGRKSYNIEIQATDATDSSLTATIDVTIAVVDRNDKPNLDDATLSVREDAAVNAVVGSLTATDQDPATTLSWAIAPSTLFRVVSTGDLTADVQLITATLDYETTPSYTVTVTVTDGGITGDTTPKSDTATITIAVVDVNEVPAIAAQTRAVDENAVIGSTVGAPLVATDPDTSQLLFFTLSGASASKFTVDSQSGQLRTAVLFDFETDATTYTFTCTVTDNGSPSLTDSATITVNINDVNEAPVFDTQSRDVSENEPAGTNVGAVLVATDPDAGDTFQFTLVTDVMDSFLVSTAGQVTTKASLNYETRNVYSIVVRCTDSAGLYTDAAVTINVLNVNEAPYLPATAYSVAEKAAAGTVVGRVEGKDVDSGDEDTLTYEFAWASDPYAGLFVITSTGEIRLGTVAPAYEDRVQPYYNTTIRVTDEHGLTGTGWANISVVNANFAPTVPNHNIDVLEGTYPFDIILWDLGASDPDTDQSLSYSIIGGFPAGDVGAFFIYRNNGSIRLNGLGMDHEGTNYFRLDVQVEDDGPGNLRAYSVVNISITDADEGPYVPETSFNVLEDKTAGFVVGTIVGSDEDEGQSATLQYELGSWDSTATADLPFQIGSASGQITVTKALDFETKSVYNLWVKATDSTTLFAQSNCTINIKNVNEVPTINDKTFTAAESLASGATIGSVAASDEDANTILTYAIIGGNTGSAFAVTSDGSLILNNLLDYENITSYTLTVRASDNGAAGSLSADATVTVTVEDVDDLSVTTFGGDVVHTTGGGQVVYISGTNLGPTSYALGNGASAATVTATYTSTSLAGATYTATACSASAPNTQIQCSTVAGVGTDLAWTVSVTFNGNTYTATTSQTTTYASPAITSVSSAAALATAGSEDFTINGADFGPAGTAVDATYVSPSAPGVVYTPTGCSVTTANSVITCTSVAGVGAALAFQVTVAGLSSNTDDGSSAYAYAKPAITGLTPPSVMHTKGGDAITIDGTNLGTGVALTAAYGPTGVEYTATDCTEQVAHTKVTCNTAPGVGVGHLWAVRVGGQTSAYSTQTTSYAPPTLTTIGGTGARNAATQGGDLVEIGGTELGPSGGTAKGGAKPIVTYGPSGTEYTAVSCNVSTEFPHDVIECFTAPGTGKDHSWQVTISTQKSALLVANTSYHSPIVSYFPRQFPGAVDALTSGDEVVVIEGDNFGSPTLGTVPVVTYGPEGREFTATECTFQTPHTSIACNTTEGAGADLRWIVVVDGQESTAPTTNYGVPQIKSISGLGATDASTDGGQALVITGQDFGPPGLTYLEYVKYGPTGIEYEATGCNVDSHTQVTCTTVAGIGRTNYLTMRVQGQTSQVSTVTQSYAAPVLSTLTPDNAVTAGGSTIVMRGTNWGLNDIFTSIKVEFNGGVYNVTEPFTHAAADHELKFVTPVGYGVGKKVRLLLTGPNVFVTSNYVDWMYSPPVITGFSPEATHRTIDGLPEFKLVVLGTSFCKAATCGKLYLGTEELTPTNWTHDSITTFTTSANANLTVVVGTDPARTSNGVVYENVVPIISALTGSQINSATYNTAGGDLLVFKGEQFSQDGMSVTVGGRDCPFVTGYPVQLSASEYELQCYCPPGEGTENPVIVYLGKQETFNYDGGTDGMNVRYKPPVFRYVTLEATAADIVTVEPDGKTLIAHMPTQGGWVLIWGEQFGRVEGGQELVYFYGFGSLPTVTAPRNHTVMRVDIPEGDGQRYLVSLKVGGQDTTNALYVAYDPPQITDVSPTNGPTAGNVTITITGINFGVTTPTVKIGTETCTTVTWTHYQITCTLPPNQGTGHVVTVTVNGQASNQAGTYTFNYDPPTVTALTPASGDTPGGTSVTLTGTNLGRRDAIVYFSAGTDTAAPSGYVVQAGNVTSQTDDMIVFDTPVGQGVKHLVTVSISGQLSPANVVVSFDYNPPAVTGLNPPTADTKGGDLLTISGSNFGTGLDTSVTIGGRACTAPKVGHSTLTCIIPQGLGQDLDVIVSVLLRTSVGFKFSYNLPIVYTVIPNTPSANGEPLQIVGKNFGWERTDAKVVIGTVECKDAVWQNDERIDCVMQQDVAGQKDVNITVAGQNMLALAPFVPQCDFGFYAQAGELCIECPLGGICNGSFLEPYADAGWWMQQVATPNEACATERLSRTACPVVIPCEPNAACLGNNSCAVGYEGERCGSCTLGTYYRLAGECVKCGDNPWLVVAAVLVGALVVAVAGYILNRKDVNLAFLAIGVDYFQVLAIFASAKLQWPDQLYSIFQYMQVFLGSLEIAAPECVIPNIDYVTKWLSIMGLPLGAGVLFLLLHVTRYCHKRWIKRVKPHQRNSHASAMVGSFLVIFYFLYLYLTRTILEVFNCSPTDPPDGKEYLNAVFEECGLAGGVQLTLLPFAIIALILYVASFPLLVVWKLYRNKELVKLDQYLRVMKVGDKREMRDPTEHRRYQFRKRWSKMYYQFKPGKWYWILVIIARKALLALSALFFRKTVAFQLAMVLLILIAAYALQVRHSPFMNMYERDTIIEAFKTKVAASRSKPGSLYATINDHINRILTDDRRQKKKAFSWDRRPNAREVAQFFWDTNTVEAVFLMCAILVALSGIMFQSERFETSYYAAQQETIMWLVIVVVLGSFLYFCIVFLAELFDVFSPKCLVSKKKRQEALIKAKEGDVELAAGFGDRRTSAHFQNNPMMTGEAMIADEEAFSQKDLDEVLNSNAMPNAAVWTAVRERFKRVQTDVSRLNQENRKLKKDLQQGGSRRRAPGRILASHIKKTHGPARPAGGRRRRKPAATTGGAAGSGAGAGADAE